MTRSQQTGAFCRSCATHASASLPDLTMLIDLLQQALDVLQAHRDGKATMESGESTEAALPDEDSPRLWKHASVEESDDTDDPMTGGASESGSEEKTGFQSVDSQDFATDSSDSEGSDMEDSGLESAPAYEIRCYRVPSLVAKDGREFLSQHKAETLTDLFDQIYDDFFSTILLLRNFDESKELDGFTLQLIGEQLARPLDRLSWACSHIADFTLLPESVTS